MQGLCQWCGADTQLSKAYMWSDFFRSWWVGLFWKEMYMKCIFESRNASVLLNTEVKKTGLILKQKYVLPFLELSVHWKVLIYQHLDCRAAFPGAPCCPLLQAMAVCVACVPTVFSVEIRSRGGGWWVNPGVCLGCGRQLCLGRSWHRNLEAWGLYSPGSII